MAVGNVIADDYLQVANFVTDETAPRGEPPSEILFEGRLLEWGFDEIAHRVFGEILEHSLHVLATDCTRSASQPYYFTFQPSGRIQTTNLASCKIHESS